ncbi:hypothetical protein [Moorena sp. SIO2C4]|nr:hypothetical protein [Moorena sp. SIO2C4]
MNRNRLISYQLLAISYQLSAISYQLSAYAPSVYADMGKSPDFQFSLIS